MENFLLSYLPEEMVCKIIYENKAIQTPAAKVLSPLFKQMNEAIDQCWESWNYPYRPDTDRTGMTVEFFREHKEFVDDYNRWMERNHERDEMKIAVLNYPWFGNKGADQMDFTTFERNYLGYDDEMTSGGFGDFQSIAIIIEEVE